MIKNVGRNVDIFYTLWICVSDFLRVAVTHYLSDQTLDKKVTLKIGEVTLF